MCPASPFAGICGTQLTIVMTMEQKNSSDIQDKKEGQTPLEKAEKKLVPKGPIAPDADAPVRPDVLNFDDIAQAVPALANHRKLVERLMHFLWIDRVNQVHGRYCDTPGAEFSHKLVEEEFNIRLRLDNAEVLERFKTGPFITVSNHPFGGMDGILLIHILTTYRPDFKVIVNFFLNNLRAMRPSFIAVDPSASTDPEKRKISLQGLRAAINHVRNGHPIGFFPAGAVSKVQWNLHVRDRQWQESMIRLIQQMNVPVIPVYFHGHNSTFFNILGMIDWRIRTLRLPREVFLMRNKEIHVSIGDPIMPEELEKHPDLADLGKMLRERTYALEKIK